MDRNYFDQIGEAIYRQKQLMDQLEAENRELRRQLADLRAGRGILVDLWGTRFALRESPSPRDPLLHSSGKVHFSHNGGNLIKTWFDQVSNGGFFRLPFLTKLATFGRVRDSQVADFSPVKNNGQVV